VANVSPDSVILTNSASSNTKKKEQESFDLDSLEIILTTVGLIIAFSAGSVANVAQDWLERKRARKALYNEIVMMQNFVLGSARQLEEISKKKPATEDDYTKLKITYDTLPNELSASTYNAVKALPTLSYGLAEIRDIDTIYFIVKHFDRICQVVGETEGFDPALFETETSAQAATLSGMCKALSHAVEAQITSSRTTERGLDKKLLLKEALSSKLGDETTEYWKDLLGVQDLSLWDRMRLWF
jgi:hypothetical protein